MSHLHSRGYEIYIKLLKWITDVYWKVDGAPYIHPKTLYINPQTYSYRCTFIPWSTNTLIHH